ncbi:MAG: hypothetical protein HC862_02910 [Scytonema sp. RU_4_4]|nr:hypothetical protein [Scytonema sp. RU_4_4]
MKVSIESAVLYNGITYFPDDSGFAEVPDEVAEALNLTKVTSSTVVEDTSSVEDTGESGKLRRVAQVAVPPLNVNDALSQFQQIPAVAQLYEESERPHVERILEANKGTLKTGGTAYRIYASAASYLSTHPQFFVKKHDNTELNDIQKTVDGFCRYKLVRTLHTSCLPQSIQTNSKRPCL